MKIRLLLSLLLLPILTLPCAAAHWTLHNGTTTAEATIPAQENRRNIAEKQILFATSAHASVLRNLLPAEEFILTALPVTSLTPVGAVLTGEVATTEAVLTDIQFEYGTSGNFTHTVAATPETVAPNQVKQLTHEISGLTPSTYYRYRIRATYQGTVHVSEPVVFLTPPYVHIEYIRAMAVTYHTAELTAPISAYLVDITDIQYEYGPGNSFSQLIDASPTSIQGRSYSAVTATLTDLEPGTTYKARLKFTYNGTRHTSAALEFSTRPTHSIAISRPYFNTNGIHFDADVTAIYGDITNIVFEYGTSREYGSTVVASPGELAEGATAKVRATVKDFDRDAIYYARVKALQHKKEIYSSEIIFRASGGILLLPNDADEITATSARLSGLVVPQGRYIDSFEIEYGETEAYERSYRFPWYYDAPLETQSLRTSLYDLSPNTLYHYRIKCMVKTTAYYSIGKTFRTASLTSLADESDPKTLIYPNPTHGKLSVSHQDMIQKIEVYDQVGKLVLSIMPKTQAYELDLTDQGPGIYMIKLYQNQKIINRKIIKL